MAIYNYEYLNEFFFNKKKNTIKKYELTEEDYNKAVAFIRRFINKCPSDLKSIFNSRFKESLTPYDELKKKGEDTVYLSDQNWHKYIFWCTFAYPDKYDVNKLSDEFSIAIENMPDEFLIGDITNNILIALRGDDGMSALSAGLNVKK